MIKRLYHFFILLSTLTLGVTSCQSGLFQSHITPAPTPQCVEPTLTLGITKFRVASIQREEDGFPKIPKNNKEMAFWVDGTMINYVFGLSPTKDNLRLNTVLKAGDPIVISWADCSTDEYVVKSVDTASVGDASIFDQSTGGITIFVGVNASSSGQVIRGERPIPQAMETSVPLPENAIQVDLQILEFTQPDDQTIQFRINLTNQGTKIITLTKDDVSLKTENGPDIPPLTIQPILPQELKPGDILPVTLTFPKPDGNSAVLRIFDVTLEYYF